MTGPQPQYAPGDPVLVAAVVSVHDARRNEYVLRAATSGRMFQVRGDDPSPPAPTPAPEDDERVERAAIAWSLATADFVPSGDGRVSFGAVKHGMVAVLAALHPAPPTPDPRDKALLLTDDSVKMVRETLCVAQSRIGRSVLDTERHPEHIARLGRLIAECDRHRPLGSDGKHGDLHTKTCGCEHEPGPVWMPPETLSDRLAADGQIWREAFEQGRRSLEGIPPVPAPPAPNPAAVVEKVEGVLTWALQPRAARHVAGQLAKSGLLRAEEAAAAAPATTDDPLANVKIGDPDPTPQEGRACAVDWGYRTCYREPGHPGQHIAADRGVVTATRLDPPAAPATTDDDRVKRAAALADLVRDKNVAAGLTAAMLDLVDAGVVAPAADDAYRAAGSPS